MTEWLNPADYPDYYDPTLWGGRHPILPAGYNSTDINGDEFDGSGINWAIWPVVFDSYEAGTPLIIRDEELEVFAGCADIVIGCENNTIVFRRAPQNITIRRTG